MELPKRKPNRLKNYDYSQNGAYFVTICTQHRVHLFGEIVGAALCGSPNNPNMIIEKWLLEIQNKYDTITIDKHVIMPNHLHCIIIISGDQILPFGYIGSPLPQILDWFKTMTTNEYICGVKNGLYPPFEKRIWQRSYHDHIIRNEQEYLKIWEYIDTNQLKWALDCFYKPFE